MKVQLVRIGNSRGIRIPKPVIEQCGFGEAVQLRVEHDRVILAADRTPRQGWAEAFEAAGSATRDELLLDPLEQNEFDRGEWSW